MLTKPSVFYYVPIVSCNLVSIKLLLLLLLLTRARLVIAEYLFVQKIYPSWLSITIAAFHPYKQTSYHFRNTYVELAKSMCRKSFSRNVNEKTSLPM